MKRPLELVMRFLGSYALACLLLFFLGIAVLGGTWAQGGLGLHGVQVRYFQSAYYVVHAGPIPIPLPGGMLLMCLLAVNLAIGGIVRMRFTWSRAGILITHFGIAFLLLQGAWEYRTKEEGQVTLFENAESRGFPAESNTYTSFSEWEIVLRESVGRGGGSAVERVIDDSEFVDLEAGRPPRRFSDPSLPFELSFENYVVNAAIAPAALGGGIDGYAIRRLPPDPEVGFNVAALEVRVRESSGREQHGILFGDPGVWPYTFEVGGVWYDLLLRHRVYDLPFTVRLVNFERELHPGTGMAKSYSSDVKVLDGANSRDVHISMNEPLRDKGHVLYQTNWGPQSRADTRPTYSVLTVAVNPADRLPIAACVVIALGLVLHFLAKLYRYVEVQRGLA